MNARLRWVLIASLALNVFLGGLYSGHWLGLWRDGERGHPPLRLHLGSSYRELPPAAREAAEQAMARHRPAVRAAFQRMREAREAVRVAIAAEPFDAAALDRALAAYRVASGAAHAEMHRSMAELAATLTPEGRKAMAEEMLRRAERRRHRND